MLSFLEMNGIPISYCMVINRRENNPFERKRKI